MAAPPPDDERNPAQPQSNSPSLTPQFQEVTEPVGLSGSVDGIAAGGLPPLSRTGQPPTPASRPPTDAAGDSREFAWGERISRYMVLRAIGQGGMGVVYAAYDPELDRKVALKLLRPGSKDPDPSAGRARLLREAQAMARVSHPNVCSVFDVGTVGDQVFMAMEFIEGLNLQQWMKQGEHPWRDTLRMFTEAGRGLAAAHEAGLVHRDFKPANVLIGKGERVYVTDFGLARLVTSSEEELPAPAEPSSRRGTTSALTSSVTQHGHVMGTPQYMSPEQYLGKVPDARSDQFSFCAALYWALYRKRPFEPGRVANAAQELSLAAHTELGTAPLRPVPALQGVIQEPPAGSKVPAWVRRAVLRGLALRPDDRFPSMKELLEELSQEQRRERRRWALAGAGLLVMMAVGVGVQLRRQSQVCVGADRLMTPVWNPEVKHKLETAFSATGKPYAQEMAQSTVKVLDGYARDWAGQHTEACVATRVRGAQTEALLSLRMVCLERRRKDFQELARLLTEADGRLVVRAVDAAHSLPALQDCEDIDSLTNQVALPADPTQRAQIEQLGAELSAMRALGRAGRYDDALKKAQALERPVVSTGYLPLQAELRSSMGWYKQLTGDADAGAQQVEQALNDAEAGRADRSKVDALNKLLFIRGIQGKPEQAEQWARLSDSALKRIGGDPLLASELLGNQGNVALRQGRYQDAGRYFQKTRDLQEKVLAPDDPRRIRTTYNLGVATLLEGNKLPRATELLNEALQQMKSTLGSQHPEVALCHTMLSWAYRDSGEFDRALDHAEAAVAIRKVAFSEEHPAVADALDAVGMSLIKLKRYNEAQKTFQTALAMKEKALGKDSLELSFSYDGIGQALLAAGRFEEAIAPLQKALSFDGVEPEPLAESGFSLARALWDSRKDPEKALAEATKARERFAQVGKKARVAEVEAWLKSRPLQKASPPRRGIARSAKGR